MMTLPTAWFVAQNLAGCFFYSRLLQKQDLSKNRRMLFAFLEYEFANDKMCQNLQGGQNLAIFEDIREIVDQLTIKNEQMTQKFAS